MIWNAFVIVAEETLRHGGKIAFEWPTGCTYWQLSAVQNFMMQHGMVKANLDGCAMGLKSRKTGMPIRKPWTVASNCPALIHARDGRLCPGPDYHPEHTTCRGQDAK